MWGEATAGKGRTGAGCAQAHVAAIYPARKVGPALMKWQPMLVVVVVVMVPDAQLITQHNDHWLPHAHLVCVCVVCRT